MRILIAEDDRINQRVIIGLLYNRSIEGVAVATGLAAVEELTRRSYSMVLMDINMPEMDGLTAARRIRDPASGVLNPSIPIAAVTAYTGEKERAACFNAGMDEFLPKPVADDKLMRIIQRLVPNFQPRD